MDYARASRQGAIGTVTLGDGQKGNAVGLDDWNSIHAALAELAHDDAIRVIVLRGGGEGVFVTGARLGDLRDAPPDAFNISADPTRWLVAEIDKPIIAAIDGPCIGLGVEIALWADIRLCSSRAVFSIRAAQLGRVLGQVPLESLVRAVGVAQARYMVLTACDLDAGSALRIGLVHDVSEPGKLAERLHHHTERMGLYAPAALAANKAQLRALPHQFNPTAQLAG
jgi:E-phenylitaconyl-CoA hydratase